MQVAQNVPTIVFKKKYKKFFQSFVVFWRDVMKRAEQKLKIWFTWQF